MRKVVIHSPGSYEKLRLEEHTDPTPGVGEVLVETAAMGVNFADCCVRFGVYDSAKKYVGWPITPGFDFAGRVTQIGPEVTNVHVGDEVLGLVRFGGYATHVVASAQAVFPIPRDWTLLQAGGFPTVSLTAYHALYQSVILRPGMTVLIHSAAGGVGSYLVQMAKLGQCRVIGVVGSEHKVLIARSLGCDVVIDKSRDPLWPAVEAAAPEGVDIVCDANGPATLAESYRHLRPTGRLIVYGFHTMLPQRGGKIDYWRGLWGFLKMPRFNPFRMVSANKGVIGFNLSYLFDRYDLLAPAFGQALNWANEKRIQPPAITTYPLQEVGEAHRALESGKTTGKIVLVP